MTPDLTSIGLAVGIPVGLVTLGLGLAVFIFGEDSAEKGDRS
jgi:hypothetical protein